MQGIINKILMCFVILSSSYVYSSDEIDIDEEFEKDLDEIPDDEDSTESSNDEVDNNKNSKKDKEYKSNESNINTNGGKDNDKEIKLEKAVGGWYSGLDIKYVHSKLTANETKKDDDNTSTTYKYDTKSNFISPSLTLGYDFLLSKLVLGGECGVGFNFGSSTSYRDKVYNQNIADIKCGTTFTGAIKLGVALGSFVVYGKVGGNLTKWNYNWKIDDKDKEKKYRCSASYGGGIEKQFLNKFYLRTEFAYNPTNHSNTSIKLKDCKLNDVKTNNYQFSIGGGYRF